MKIGKPKLYVILPAAAICLLVFSAIFANWIAPFDPFRTDLRARAQLPSMTHWLGTDEQGRDILSRVMFGLRLTLTMGAAGLVAGVGIGAAIGIVAAYYRRLDMLLMRLIDVLLSFPGILLALAIAGVTGPGMLGIVLALAVSTVGSAARVSRSIAQTIVSLDYVASARMVGLSSVRVMTRYVLRNALPSIVVYATLTFGQLILLGASLSFLGLGLSPPAAELGVMVSSGRTVLMQAPHVALMPCAVIMVLVLSFNLLGDTLRDVLDPLMKV